MSDTPRTDAAWAKTFQDDEDQCRAGNAATDMRDECATLERELAALGNGAFCTPTVSVGFIESIPNEVELVIAELRARAERAEAEAERYRLVTLRQDAELTTERARLDYLLQWDVTFHDRADIDAELSYGQRKKSTPTLP